jgi:hypothetical protein
MLHDFSTVTQGHTEAARNTVLGTSANYGIAIVGGTDGYVHDNVIISSGTDSTGRKFAASTSGAPNAMALWKPSWQPAGTPSNNRMENNLIGYWASMSNVRKDGWWDQASQPPAAGNFMGNSTIYKPGQQIFHADEVQHYNAWTTRRIAAGVSIGPDW